MTREEWYARLLQVEALRTLAIFFEQEHDWDADEDPSASRELLRDVRAIHEQLAEQLGEPPNETVAQNQDLPF